MAECITLRQGFYVSSSVINDFLKLIVHVIWVHYLPPQSFLAIGFEPLQTQQDRSKPNLLEQCHVLGVH